MSPAIPARCDLGESGGLALGTDRRDASFQDLRLGQCWERETKHFLPIRLIHISRASANGHIHWIQTHCPSSWKLPRYKVGLIRYISLIRIPQLIGLNASYSQTKLSNALPGPAEDDPCLTIFPLPSITGQAYQVTLLFIHDSSISFRQCRAAQQVLEEVGGRSGEYGKRREILRQFLIRLTPTKMARATDMVIQTTDDIQFKVHSYYLRAAR